MSVEVNCRKRLGIRDRFVIVKLAVQHALNPNTERYMFASKTITDDKIKVSHYSNFNGEQTGARALNVVSEWMVELFIERVTSIEQYNRYIRGYNISLFKVWAKARSINDKVGVAENIFMRVPEEEPCQKK